MKLALQAREKANIDKAYSVVSKRYKELKGKVNTSSTIRIEPPIKKSECTASPRAIHSCFLSLSASYKKYGKEKAKAKVRKQTVNKLGIFRANLIPGSKTNCGLVIDTRGAIVLVQNNKGMKWIQRNEVFEAGHETCLPMYR